MLSQPMVATVLDMSFAGGFVRGMSGFGGSLVMMPLLTIVALPRFAVGPVLLLEAFAAAPMLRGALCRIQWRVVLPPVVVYLLSGPAPRDVTRANLTFTVIAISIAALVVLWVRGALLIDGPLPLWLVAPGYIVGIGVGSLLFGRFDERRFRQTTLGILVVVSAIALIM